MNLIGTIAITTLGGIVRNGAGWLENAWEDGQISPYEWGQLGSTIFRIVVLGVATGYGLNLDPLASAGSGIVLDFILKALKAKTNA